MRTFFNFIGGLFLGAAVGGLLALLFAPSSGEKLREDVAAAGRDKGSELREQLARLRGEIVAE